MLFPEFSDDQGYFGERLAAARLQLVRAWQKRAGQLAPQGRRTDVLGEILSRERIISRNAKPLRNVLVIYSDMRHVNRELDLETPAIIRIDAALAKVDQHRLPLVNGARFVAHCVAQKGRKCSAARRRFNSLDFYGRGCDQVPNQWAANLKFSRFFRISGNL